MARLPNTPHYLNQDRLAGAFLALPKSQVSLFLLISLHLNHKQPLTSILCITFYLEFIALNKKVSFIVSDLRSFEMHSCVFKWLNLQINFLLNWSDLHVLTHTCKNEGQKKKAKYLWKNQTPLKITHLGRQNPALTWCKTGGKRWG